MAFPALFAPYGLEKNLKNVRKYQGYKIDVNAFCSNSVFRGHKVSMRPDT